MQLALDKVTGDLIKPESGGVARTEEGRFVVQQVRSRLRTQLGEWVLDRSVGWLSVSDFEKGYDAFSIESRARAIILSTEGVLGITQLSTSYANRVFTLTFSAKTIYGVIDLTIPWGE